MLIMKEGRLDFVRAVLGFYKGKIVNSYVALGKDYGCDWEDLQVGFRQLWTCC